MIRDDQIVFFLGIPGSGWAKIDSLLRCCRKFKFNESDINENTVWQRNTNRYYLNHKGHFLGPGSGVGEGFMDIGANYTKKSFLEECLKVYDDINEEDNYMLKCHWFCERHNINWLVRNFPNSKYVAVLRDVELCNHRWLESMTFNKDYPNYSAWMVKEDPDEKFGSHCIENEQNLKRLNRLHDNELRSFVRRYADIIFCPTKYMLDRMDFHWDEKGHHEFTWYKRCYISDVNLYTRAPKYETSIAFYNCNEILF
tara:strand:+ start:193 stop:957 length:765 start_codon:yes stop_codon:yes gene_type:complete